LLEVAFKAQTGVDAHVQAETSKMPVMAMQPSGRNGFKSRNSFRLQAGQRRALSARRELPHKARQTEVEEMQELDRFQQMLDLQQVGRGKSAAVHC
jgi:hypothetical protein